MICAHLWYSDEEGEDEERGKESGFVPSQLLDALEGKPHFINSGR